MGFRALTAAMTAFAAFSVFALGCSATVTTTASGTPPPGCSPDDSLNCAHGGDGWTCAAGDNPENEVSNVSCSIPQPDGPNDDFCCISFTSSTCQPDPNVTGGCVYPSYGYSCAAGDDPTTFDSSLNCSAPTAVGPNEDDFCCE